MFPSSPSSGCIKKYREGERERGRGERAERESIVASPSKASPSLFVDKTTSCVLSVYLCQGGTNGSGSWISYKEKGGRGTAI